MSTLGQPFGVVVVTEGAGEDVSPDGESKTEGTVEDSAVNCVAEETETDVADAMIEDEASDEIATEEGTEYETDADENGVVVEDGATAEYATAEEDTEDTTAEDEATPDEDEKAARAAATSVSLR